MISEAMTAGIFTFLKNIKKTMDSIYLYMDNFSKKQCQLTRFHKLKMTLLYNVDHIKLSYSYKNKLNLVT